MKILDLIQWNNVEAACKKCEHFCNDPSFIEKAYPGLTSMSSGYASVRDNDGFCGYHQIYLSARDGCLDFNPAELSSDQNKDKVYK